jgi:hypothetical protein
MRMRGSWRHHQEAPGRCVWDVQRSCGKWTSNYHTRKLALFPAGTYYPRVPYFGVKYVLVLSKTGKRMKVPVYQMTAVSRCRGENLRIFWSWREMYPMWPVNLLQLLSFPPPLPLPEEFRGMHWLRGGVGHMFGLNAVAKKEIPVPGGNWTLVIGPVAQYILTYTALKNHVCN